LVFFFGSSCPQNCITCTRYSSFFTNTISFFQNQNKWLLATRQAAAESTDERLSERLVRHQGCSLAGQESDRLRGRVVADFHVRRATPGRLAAAAAAAQPVRKRLPAESEDAHPHHHKGDGATAATATATAAETATAGQPVRPVQSGRATHAQGLRGAAKFLFNKQIHQTSWHFGRCSGVSS
jgi:hypothetical protein